jgi:hypothetical protein
MSGRKGKGNGPHGYFETARACRRRIASGKGLGHEPSVTVRLAATAAKRKGAQHGR